ncbi:MAG: DUF3343 domain-containing protein [Peptostreptococcaceae bacterium]|nr:DUF3343 domain-containing protein [Peptostreptococcaceae bacterium]
MEKNKFIITFFTQYGALGYSKLLKSEGMENITRPVPRDLSSSCGICVELETDRDILQYQTEDVESIVQLGETGYKILFKNQE